MFEQIKKAKKLFDVYKAGQAVADPVFLKKGQLTVNAVTVLLGTLVAAAKAFNVDIPLDNTQLVQIGTTAFTLVGLFNAHATIASTTKLGTADAVPVPDTTAVLIPPAIPDVAAPKMPSVSASDNKSRDYTNASWIPDANV